MKYYKQFVIIAPLALWAIFSLTVSRAAAADDNCIACHREINPDIVTAFQNDAHSAAGLSCAACHGGDQALPDESAMEKKHGFIGAPKRPDIPAFCGKCHSDPGYMRNYNPSLPTDQADKYWTSRHGNLLKKGDAKVATCASCHRAHGILSAKIPNSSVYPLNVPATCASCHAVAAYMAPYGIPTDQYAQYTDSSNVHGYALFVKRDVGAPACNDCHGNHGANPPGVGSVGQVCTQCHALNGELFRNSPHKEAFDMLEVSECAFCHQASPDISDPHRRIHLIVHPTYRLIGTDQRAVCSQCHTSGDTGWSTATAISTERDTLEVKMARAKDLLNNVERRGFEISDARWLLDGEVRHSLMELRTAVHAFNLNSYLPVYTKADTALDKVLTAGYEAEKEVGGRRAYFIVITILIAVLAVALTLKLREMAHGHKDEE